MKKILNEWRRFIIKESGPSIPYNEDSLEPNYSLFLDFDDETLRVKKSKIRSIVKTSNQNGAF